MVFPETFLICVLNTSKQDVAFCCAIFVSKLEMWHRLQHPCLSYVLASWLVGASIMDKMLFSYSKFPLLMNTSSCLLLPRYIFRSTSIYRNMYYRPRPLHKYSGYRHFVHFGVHTQTRLTQLWPVQYLRNRNETKFLMCAALLCLIYSWQDK